MTAEVFLYPSLDSISLGNLDKYEPARPLLEETLIPNCSFSHLFQMLVLLQGLVPTHSPEEEELEAGATPVEKEKEETEVKEQPVIPDVK